MKNRIAIIILSLLFLMMTLLSSNQRDALGDVNNDGIVNVLDIVNVLNIILELNETPTDYQIWASNVNLDEQINVQDVVILVNVIIGIQCPDEFYIPCSDNLSECCVETTFHEFDFELDTFGNYGSWINDVQIISEDNIWIVGNIETDSGEYNAGHWDGSDWSFMEIINSADLHSVCYFAEDDIWLNKVTYPVHWDGFEWTQFDLSQLGIDGGSEECWGISSDNIYFVGMNGSIVHYDGETFIQMDSGTEVDLYDISGSINGEHLFAVGLTNSDWWGNIILEYSENSWNTLYESDHYLPENGDYGAVLNVSVLADTAYIMTMGGLWKYNYLDQSSSFVQESTYNEGNYFHSKQIIAKGFNDIFTVSSRWNTAHYNGDSWYYDNSVSQYYGSGNVWCKSADYNAGMFVVVGYVSNPQTALVMRAYIDNN